MYKLTYKTHFDAAHWLDLPYKSKCRNFHGHRYYVKIIIEADELTKEGMVIDFSKLKEIVEKLDHTCLNTVLDVNPTCEMIAFWLYRKIKSYFSKRIKLKVKVWETPNASVEYYEDK